MADRIVSQWNEIPPGVVGFIHDDATYDEDDQFNEGPTIDADDNQFVNIEEFGGEDVLLDDVEFTDALDEDEIYVPVPSSFSIVSQTVRLTPNGNSVVDVVIEVSDIPNVSKYEVRLTKAV